MLYPETTFCLQQHWWEMGEHHRKMCVYNKGVLTCLGSHRFSYTDFPLLHISKFPQSPLFSSFIEYCSTCYPTWNIHNGLQRVEQNCIHIIHGTGKRSICVQIILFYTNTFLTICKIKNVFHCNTTHFITDVSIGCISWYYNLWLIKSRNWVSQESKY